MPCPLNISFYGEAFVTRLDISIQLETIINLATALYLIRFFGKKSYYQIKEKCLDLDLLCNNP